jgi:hypothetical protein
MWDATSLVTVSDSFIFWQSKSMRYAFAAALLFLSQGTAQATCNAAACSISANNACDFPYCAGGASGVCTHTTSGVVCGSNCCLNADQSGAMTAPSHTPPNSTPDCIPTPSGNFCTYTCDGGFTDCGDSNCVVLGSGQGAACCTGSTCGSVPNGGFNCTNHACARYCNGGYHDCSGSCADNNSTNSCGSSCSACPTPANGSATCNGSSCGIACNGGFHNCTGSCVDNTSVNNCGGSCSACATPPSGHGHSACDGSSCSIVCDGGYHLCGGDCTANTDPAYGCGASNCVACAAPTGLPGQASCNGATCSMTCNGGGYLCGTQCIANGTCCNNASCSAGPACYQANGTCSGVGGTCTYALANGQACNADSSKCTPNDYCMNGSCVADTAHQVTCTPVDCHSAPSCNASTGNCDSTPLTGTTCGNTGCFNTVATCNNGVCQGAVPKDCSSGLPQCKVGVCDSNTGNCGSDNAANGTTCTLADLCQENGQCSGGTCVGTPKSCTTSNICKVSVCDSTDGVCKDQNAPAGTSCDKMDPCSQHGSCDDSGNCVAQTVVDGTPCTNTGCDSAACVAGTCTCPVSDDLAVPADLSVAPPHTGKNKSSSCAIAPVPSYTPLMLVFTCLLALAIRRRSTRAR